MENIVLILSLNSLVLALIAFISSLQGGNKMKYDCRIDSEGSKIEFSGNADDLFMATLIIMQRILSEDDFYIMCHNLGCVKRETEMYQKIKEDLG